MHIIIHWFRPTECTTPRVNPNVNYGFVVIMVCQWRFYDCNKYILWWGTVMVGEAMYVWGVGGRRGYMGNLPTIFFFFVVLLGLNPLHMEVPKRGVKLRLWLLAYTTATTPDPNCILDLHHSSQQSWILSPLSKAGDRTHIFMDTSQVLKPLSPSGNSSTFFLILLWTLACS